MDAKTSLNHPIQKFHDTLENGLPVITVEMPHIHSTELALFIRSGLRFEEQQNNGISHFLEHMMFRGNRKYPDSLSLNREFEKIGRDFRASTLSEYTYYGFSPQVDEVDRSVELMAEFFTEPLFPDIELERGIILEECLEDLNEEGVNIDINNQACNLLYPGDPLAWPTIGTEETIASITVEKLQGYFKKFYHPGNMVLVGAGAISHELFLRSAEKHFARLPKREAGIAPDYFLNSIKEDQKEPALLFVENTDSQVQLQICFRGLSYNDPDYYAATLLSRIFDDGVTSRLQRSLREDRGLVYSVECRATSLSDTGTFDFDVSARQEKAVEVIRVILDEIKALLQEGPTEEELRHFKRRYEFDLDIDLDDPYKQIIRFGFAQLYSKEVTVEEERALIEAVTLEDLRRVASAILVREKLNIILLGPHTSEIKNEIQSLAKKF